MRLEIVLGVALVLGFPVAGGQFTLEQCELACTHDAVIGVEITEAQCLAGGGTLAIRESGSPGSVFYEEVCRTVNEACVDSCLYSPYY